MKAAFPSKISTESVFVWLMHRIADEFNEHAILKGGMSFALLDSPRKTNDLDYVFVPYSSKKEFKRRIENILSEIPQAKIETSMNSKMVNFAISVGGVNVQIEANAAPECKSIPMSTASLSRKAGQLARVIRMMSFDVALSHKLAAWNERRLLRDLYDAYFIFKVIGEKPDKETLQERLAKVESRIPKFKNVKKMSLEVFIEEFEKAVSEIDDDSIGRELSPLMVKGELAGLSVKLKAGLNSLAEYLRTWDMEK